MSQAVLYYMHDPMCSWCWGFRDAWQYIQRGIVSEVSVERVLGGLAPDSNDPMPQALQATIKENWRRIQKTIPNVEFNYAFWSVCQPRRSTYSACRAVLAAKLQHEKYENEMIYAIQKAYYLDAKNPSDHFTLIILADALGLNAKQFEQDLNSNVIHGQLDNHIRRYRELSQWAGVSGFPSLALRVNESFYAVPIDYVNPQATVDFIYGVI